MITKTYRKLVPQRSRDYIYSIFLGKFLFYKRNFHILYPAFLAHRFNYYDKSELGQTLKFIGKHGLRSCPGEFSLKYDNFDCEVKRDTHPFVIHQGKKLYFPEKFKDKDVKRIYKSLIIEQDPDSAHRYSLIESDYEDSIMFDIGAAEGILTLEKIDTLKAAVLVECEKQWVEALEKTFSPYSEKVKIVFKYIDQLDTETSISLNTLGLDYINEKIFVKMDIEGFEKKALLGGDVFLKNNQSTIAVCTYHNPQHPKEIKELLENYGFKTSFSKGFLYWGLRLSKALIRAKNH